jgi:hypothetical protein
MNEKTYTILHMNIKNILYALIAMNVDNRYAKNEVYMAIDTALANLDNIYRITKDE